MYFVYIIFCPWMFCLNTANTTKFFPQPLSKTSLISEIILRAPVKANVVLNIDFTCTANVALTYKRDIEQTLNLRWRY